MSGPRPFRWRLVFAVQRLISLVFPPLHSIRWKLFALYFAILILPAVYLSWNIRRNLETSYLHSTEEGMIDVAAVVAELYTRLIKQYGSGSPRLKEEIAQAYANLDQTYQIKARLFGYTKKEVDTRLLIYDARGLLLFDTSNLIPPGTDLSGQGDVREALRGKYGARWELDKPHQRVNLYSTLPVFTNGQVVGAVSVSKPTNRVRNFITNSLEHILIPCFVRRGGDGGTRLPAFLIPHQALWLTSHCVPSGLPGASRVCVWKHGRKANLARLRALLRRCGVSWKARPMSRKWPPIFPMN